MTQRDSIQIQLVDVERIIDLRWRLLRAGLPRETAYFEGDDEPTSRHLAAIRADAVIGCATILRRSWQGKPAWQLRGMAVEPSFQGSGVGRLLVNEIERIVRSEPHSLQLWCNARTPATPFYRRLGWAAEGQEFEIPTAGPHYNMSKLLI